MSVIDSSTPFGRRAEHRLNTEQIIWFVTVGTRGNPQPSPVWFLPVGDDKVLIYSQPDKPKLRAIGANPRVALAFNTDPEGEEVVIFRGIARIDQSTPSALEHPTYLDKYRGGITRIGMTPESFSDAFSVPVIVALEGIRGI